MLDDNPHQPYYYQIDAAQVDKSEMFAYADDLNGISPSIEHLQAMAELVSAFNAITGFSFNQKLECGTNSSQQFEDILIYDRQWNPTAIKIRSKMTVTILGVPIDLTNKWADLKAYIQHKIKSLSIPIVKKNVSFHTKILAYTMAVLPGIIYPAKFLNLTIAEHETLFAPLDRFLREVAQLMRSTHINLLYMRTSKAGLRLMDIIMQIQKLKQRML